MIQLKSNRMLLNAKKSNILVLRRTIIFETITSWSIWSGIKLGIVKVSQTVFLKYLYAKFSLLIMTHPILIGITLGGCLFYGISHVKINKYWMN